MRKITIVGAGQSGLQLGIGLVDAGYDVTIVSNRTAEEIRNGKVSSSQCMFGGALSREHVLGLDFWAQECPPIEGISFTISDGNGGSATSWSSRLDLSANSVDQRVKVPIWIAEFKKRGGFFEVRDVSIGDLDQYAADSDLVIVAAGKGEIARLFPRDSSKSFFENPQRSLALTYVTGMVPREPHSAVTFNMIPGVGEYFAFPALTTTGPCEIMVMEGIPGGPMDCWDDVATPEQHLARSKWILDTYLPWEAQRCKDIRLTDDNGYLAGRFAPTVRKPVGMLPSGRQVLGVADVVVLNDPITGQGANNASKCAASYLASILDHGDRQFDETFMNDTFERYWDYARYVVTWTNALLSAPADHVLELLTAATANPRIARRFVNGFDDPRDFFHWFMDPAAAESYLADIAVSES